METKYAISYKDKKAATKEPWIWLVSTYDSIEQAERRIESSKDTDRACRMKVKYRINKITTETVKEIE